MSPLTLISVVTNHVFVNSLVMCWLVLSFPDPDPVLSPMVISWLVSGLTFVVALIIIIIVAKVLCQREEKPSELERETRTCELFWKLILFILSI